MGEVWIITAGCHHCETVEIVEVLDHEPAQVTVDAHYEHARKRCVSSGVSIEKHSVTTREEA